MTAPPGPDSKARVSRRTFLRTTAVGGLAAGVAGTTAAATPTSQSGEDLPDLARLVELADALLPSELTPGEREGVAQALRSWLREYREGELMDHGYGFTRVRHTGPSPGPGYVRDLEDLDAAARSRFGRPLAALDPEQIRTLAREAIERTAPEIESLPSRPAAPHVTIALLATYYRSAAANDRAYGKAIRQETCRGLFTDVEGLQPYGPGIVDADREGRR